MWASSQPRENEQCLPRGAQNSLSQWNVLASQAEGNFHFFFKTLVGTVLPRQTGRRGSSMWGLGLGLADDVGLAGLWVAAEDIAKYAPFLLK